MSLPPKKYLAILVVAVLAVLGGLVGPRVYGRDANGSAKDRIEASPPPALFPDHQVAEVDRLVTPQDRRAHRLMRAWWAGHGAGRHDAAFVAWVEESFPSPPGAAARTRELARVDALARTRSAAGVEAATWLEQFGKKDVWKLYAHDQAEWVAGGTGDARKSGEKDLLSMTKTIADDLGTKFQQSAPYVLEPSLRPDHTVKDGQVCPCSYPSRHAGAAAASRVFLGHLMPHRVGDYRWMEDEIDFSRIYMAGHVPSDISGGSLLGDMVGEYFLVTRTGAAPEALG